MSLKGKWSTIFSNDTAYVFHLAAIADIVPSIEKPDKYFNSNVISTLNILECCKKLKLKNSFIRRHPHAMEYLRSILHKKMIRLIHNIPMHLANILLNN